MIVSLTNTCSYPNTMVVKLEYTIIAKIAMSGSLRSKNQASFTELHSGDGLFCVLGLIGTRCKVEDSLEFMSDLEVRLAD